MKRFERQSRKHRHHCNSNSDFLAARSGAKLSDKIVEVIKKKNTRFRYQRSLAARSGAIFIALTKSASKRNRRDNAGGNDVAIFS
jgi:hypothetical protein